jgi:hypothetical protein
MGLLLALCVARIAQAASMARASCPLTLASNASVAVAAAVPLTLHVCVFALLALAWAKVAWSDAGRRVGRAVVSVAAFVLAVLCAQVALVLATTATQDRQRRLIVSRVGAALTFLAVASEGVAFALFGRRIYKALTTKGFTSKHAPVILRLSMAFLICLVAQAALQLAAAMDPASFARWAVGVQAAHLLLDCAGVACVLLVFRNAINAKRKGNGGSSGGGSGGYYKTKKGSRSTGKWASAGGGKGGKGSRAVGGRRARRSNSSWASRGASKVSPSSSENNVPIVLAIEGEKLSH